LMMTLQQILALGNRAGYFEKYKYTRVWWKVNFPDGSYEIVNDDTMSQLGESIIRGAHQLWAERALNKVVKEA